MIVRLHSKTAESYEYNDARFLCAFMCVPQENGRHRKLAEGHGRYDGDSRHHQLHALRAVLRAAHAVDAQVVPRFGGVRARHRIVAMTIDPEMKLFMA